MQSQAKEGLWQEWSERRDVGEMWEFPPLPSTCASVLQLRMLLCTSTARRKARLLPPTAAADVKLTKPSFAALRRQQSYLETQRLLILTLQYSVLILPQET